MMVCLKKTQIETNLVCKYFLLSYKQISERDTNTNNVIFNHNAYKNKDFDSKPPLSQN